MKERAWGIFCNKDEVETLSKKLERFGRDIFEVRPLTIYERLAYVKDPVLFANEPYIIMFHASTLQYRWFVFKNNLARVM